MSSLSLRLGPSPTSPRDRGGDGLRKKEEEWERAKRELAQLEKRCRVLKAEVEMLREKKVKSKVVPLSLSLLQLRCRKRNGFCI